MEPPAEELFFSTELAPPDDDYDARATLASTTAPTLAASATPSLETPSTTMSDYASYDYVHRSSPESFNANPLPAPKPSVFSTPRKTSEKKRLKGSKTRRITSKSKEDEHIAALRAVSPLISNTFQVAADENASNKSGVNLSQIDSTEEGQVDGIADFDAVDTRSLPSP